MGRGRPQIRRQHQELCKDAVSCSMHQEAEVVLQGLGESFEGEWFSGRQMSVHTGRLN